MTDTLQKDIEEYKAATDGSPPAETKGEQEETKPPEGEQSTEETSETSPPEESVLIPDTLTVSDGKVVDIPEDALIQVLDENGEESWVKYRNIKGDGVFKPKYDQTLEQSKAFEKDSIELRKNDDWLEEDPRSFVVEAVKHAAEENNNVDYGNLILDIVKMSGLNIELVDTETREMFTPKAFTPPVSATERTLERESSSKDQELVDLKMQVDLNTVLPKYKDQLTKTTLNRAKEMYKSNPEYCAAMQKDQGLTSPMEFAIRFAITEDGTKKIGLKTEGKKQITKTPPAIPNVKKLTALEQDIVDYKAGR